MLHVLFLLSSNNIWNGLEVSESQEIEAIGVGGGAQFL